MNLFDFGERVEGYDIPVFNEREIRAAAGMLFLFMFIAIMNVVYEGQFTLLKYTITVFMADMLVRVFVSPKFSPSLILGRLMVRKQQPIYVGAPQKRFAWMIGIIISSTLFFILVVMNYFSEVMALACFICLLFLFFETAFGICIGCKIYALFNRGQVQHCPGEVCQPNQRQAIQITSYSQVLMLLGSAAFILILYVLFGGLMAHSPQ